MKLKSARIAGFRSAESVLLEGSLGFDPKMNVFYGDNGAGKSTLLDALAAALSWIPARIRSQNAQGASIKDIDVNNSMSSASISVTAQCGGGNYKWRTEKVRKGNAATSAKSDYSEVTGLAKDLVSVLNAGSGLPVLVSYPVTRAVVDVPLRIRNRHDFGALNAYDEAFTGAANFRIFFEWFRNREDIENQSARDNNGSIKIDRQLEAVRNAISRFLPGITNLRISRYPSLQMEADKQGRRIRVDQLSDGEKCMLAMVGDLARRLAIANANGDFDPLGGAGIVLIDEVDLHLHPSWQHFVVPRLLETFPNCQFFVSTHSPLVLNNVRPGNLYMVKDVDGRMEVSRPGESFGKSVLRVLEDLMGLPETLPAEIGQKLKTIYSQIAFGETSAARDGISELRSSGYDEPELAKAEMLIRRRELVGK